MQDEKICMRCLMVGHRASQCKMPNPLFLRQPKEDDKKDNKEVDAEGK